MAKTALSSTRRFVHDNDTPMRVDRFLKEHLPFFSIQNIRDLLAAKLIHWQETRRVAEKGETIVPGGVLVWQNMPDLSVLPIPNPAIALHCHYADAALLIIEKPAPLATHPLSPLETNTVVNGLIAAYPQLQGVGNRPLEPGLLHRLDNETSGLLLVAKENDSWRACRQLFEKQRIEKEYLALVSGTVKKAGTVDTALIHDRQDHRKMRPATGGKPSKSPVKPLAAITRYAPIKHYAEHTLLKITIPTGVMHQIRVHMSHLGYPIVGDRLYGNAAVDNQLPRHFLHAHRLHFIHPITHQPLDVVSPLPEELETFLQHQSL